MLMLILSDHLLVINGSYEEMIKEISWHKEEYRRRRLASFFT